jgi:hypothetical protein
MKRMLAVCLFLFCSVGAFADGFQITQMGASYGGGNFSWFVRIPALIHPNSFQKHHFGGGGMATSSLICAAPCGPNEPLSFSLTLSDLQINKVQFSGTFYPVVYFSGILNLDATRRPNSFPFHLFGTLTGCADPQCSVVLFPISVDLRGSVTGYRITQTDSGSFILASAGFQAPEPSTLALVGTGLAGFVSRLRKMNRKG